MPERTFPDRKRLLETGQLKVTVATNQHVDLVTRETWAQVQAITAEMDLALSEPIREVTESDGHLLKYITLTAGVFDAHNDAQPS